MIYTGDRKKGHLRVAVVARPQGLKGHVKVIPCTDDPDRFTDLSGLCVWDKNCFRPIALEEVRVNGKEVVLKLKGVDDRESAETLRGTELYVEPQDEAPLQDHAYFIADLMGCRVERSGEEYGTMSEVMQHGAADVYVVTLRKGGVMMFPAIRKVIRRVDIANKVIEVDAEALQEVAVYED
ncbi:MAG: ribosome maturation factor RimM [Eubacteriales bacterium]|nr:ribosome maturation factor RimM [Eubacteriales bacterium]